MKLLVCGNFLLLLFFNIQGSDADFLSNSLPSDDGRKVVETNPKHTTSADNTVAEDEFSRAAATAVAAVIAVDKTKVLSLFLFESIANKRLGENYFEKLIKKGADIDYIYGEESDPGRHTLVDRAVMLGNNRALSVLLKHGACTNVPTGYLGQTALHRANAQGDTKAAAMLIEYGASQTIVDINSKTPADIAQLNYTQKLTKAIANKRLGKNYFEKLINKGASVNYMYGEESDPGKHTLVDRAVMLGNNRALSVLLKHGANPNVLTGYLDQTALDRACAQGDIKAAAMLIKHGANQIIMDRNSNTPADIAQLSHIIKSKITKKLR